LIRVKYAPVTNYDKACLSLKKDIDKPKSEFERACGTEGCGIIEEVGPGVDANLKGRKVAFCHGGWSEFTVADVDHILIFDDSVDLRRCATAMINPLTAISIKYILLE
jgi:NADPH:quinone reductase-like Zn-dependent oxidoreductase